MPWGKYRGQAIPEVPSGYLVWCIEETDIDEPYRSRIREELAGRLGLPRHTSPRAPMLPPGELAPALKAMLEAGYRALALKNHPDRGGELETMQRVNAARDWCRTWQWL